MSGFKEASFNDKEQSEQPNWEIDTDDLVFQLGVMQVKQLNYDKKIKRLNLALEQTRKQSVQKANNDKEVERLKQEKQTKDKEVEQLKQEKQNLDKELAEVKKSFEQLRQEKQNKDKEIVDIKKEAAQVKADRKKDVNKLQSELDAEILKKQELQQEIDRRDKISGKKKKASKVIKNG